MEAAARLHEGLLGMPGGFRGAMRVDLEDVVLLDSAYGSDGGDIAIEPSTAFQIASITKTFTSAVSLMLVDDGTLSLNDRLADLVDNAPPSWSRITIHHLLTHTSGLPHWDGVPDLDKYHACGRAELLSQIASAPLRFEPGEAWSYSSLGFILLAHIAETASRQPWASLVTDRLLRPLGLHQTSIDLPPMNTVAARGSRQGTATLSFELSTVNIGTGDIWSTTGDLVRWPRVLVASDLLQPATRQQMFVSHAEVANEADGLTDIGYGYGWFTARHRDARLLFHAGDQSGFTSLLLWAPQAGLTMVVLSADELDLGPHVLPAFEQILDDTRNPSSPAGRRGDV